MQPVSCAGFDSGGGISMIASEPAYQQSVQPTGNRTTPDVAYNADPKTGLAVFDSTPVLGFFGGPWFKVGGTSAGAPEWAGLERVSKTMSFSRSSSTSPHGYCGRRPAR